MICQEVTEQARMVKGLQAEVSDPAAAKAVPASAARVMVPVAAEDRARVRVPVVAEDRDAARAAEKAGNHCADDPVCEGQSGFSKTVCPHIRIYE